jgi:hypothetical protein
VSYTIGFLAVPPTTAEAQRIFDDDIADLGYVMNVSRLWAYKPAHHGRGAARRRWRSQPQRAGHGRLGA